MTIDPGAIKRENEERKATEDELIRVVRDEDSYEIMDASDRLAIFANNHPASPVISALVAEVEALRAEQDRTNAVLAGTGHSIEWDDCRKTYYLRSKSDNCLYYPIEEIKRND